MNRKLPILVLLLLMFITTLTALGDITPPISLGESYITEDGYVWISGRNNVQSEIALTSSQRGYFEWDISSLPDNSTISQLQIEYMVDTTSSGDSGALLYQMELQPSVSVDDDVYNDAGNGTLYITTPTLVAGNTYRVNLGSDAAQDLENNLASDWFAVGWKDDPGGGAEWLVSEDDPSNPSQILIVYYSYTAYNYTFYGFFYGNGTYQGSGNVTGHDVDGSYEFNVTHSQGYTVGFDQRPIMFSFSYGTNTRRLYVTADQETFYILVPEDSYASYEFTIIDYTGQIDPGSSYFEAYRSLNGTDRLAERMVIQDLFNTVPISAVLGKTYHVKLVYDQTFDWGYWVAGIDPTPTIVLRDVAFSQRAQITYTHVTVEATRPQSTQITVDYQDTLDQTNWANLTLKYRNGTVVHTESNNASEKTFNWMGADELENYVVRVDIDHGVYGTTLKFVEHLDAEKSYVQTPDVEAFGSFGGMDTDNLIAITLTLFLFTGFTYQFGGSAGIIAGLGTITAFVGLGLADYSFNFMAFLWFLGIIGILVGRLR